MYTYQESILKNEPQQILFRIPEKTDAQTIRRLIEDSPPLDLNSLYCYLLICTHFAATSIVAESPQGICGFISAYLRPDRRDTLFVWQVAVGKANQGEGIAKAMLLNLVGREYPAPVRYMETTVSPSNGPSRALFYSTAKFLNTTLLESVLFSEADFGSQAHEDEILYRIGPFDMPKKEEEQ